MSVFDTKAGDLRTFLCLALCVALDRDQFLSVEGEGFKMARSESVVTSSKSKTRLRTAVRRLRRKMHSPALSRGTEGGLPSSPGRNLRQNTRNYRSFRGSRYSLLKFGGGESGIRTHGTVSRTHAFQACALSHSAISPKRPLLKARADFCK